jgi:DNA-binding NarL/FixJ family response regulator
VSAPGAPGALRVLVAEDDVPTRIGIRTILDAEPDIAVVAEADNGIDACRLAAEREPDVVLMDVQMPQLDGIGATRRITEEARQDARPRVIVLTTFDYDEYVYGALRAGASGFLLKRTPAEELVDAVRVVANGEALLSPELTRRLVAGFSRRDRGERSTVLDSLTDREREVLLLIARGLSNREIARWLMVSVETVKTHAKRIFMKLGVRDRAQAVVIAYESGLVVPSS